MRAVDLQAGVAYVLRGLTESEHNHAPRPPAIAMLVRSGPAGQLFVVRLRMGGARRWSPRPRTVKLETFVRAATAREIEIGWPTDGTQKAAA